MRLNTNSYSFKSPVIADFFAAIKPYFSSYQFKALLIALPLFSSCIGHKTIGQTGIEAIKFGNGGGYAGIEFTYLLNLKGELSSEGEILSIVPEKKTLQLFQEAALLKKYSYNAPSNLYSFIEINESSSQLNRIVWGIDADSIDPKVSHLYQELLSILPAIDH